MQAVLPETGQIALSLAFAVALAQFAVPLWAARSGGDSEAFAAAFADRAARAQAALLVYSFAALTTVFVTSDFSVELAARHSHTLKPLVYKVSGVWANHEGSILLWVLLLALFGAALSLVAARRGGLPDALRAKALAVQGLLGAGFLGFTLFTSNPFARLSPAPADGQGLNPLLQDIGLAIHPPLLYVGYVGFSVAFSLAVAALWQGRVDAVWARWLRPWVLFAWSFLTLGITVGSVWAYYELGWGGWWMWDPVENVSFLPWLAATALLHSILTLQQRHTFAHWTVLLAIATFSLSMIGTFVVRSGILVSVHAFAVDPARGSYLLALLLGFSGAALALYALRAPAIARRTELSLVSRESGLVVNNLLLVAATATVMLGTFYPLFVDLAGGGKISVGAPYFDLVFAPMMVLLMLFMAVTPLLRWRADGTARLRRFAARALPAVVAVGLLALWLGNSVWGAVAVAVAAWLAAGTVAALWRRTHGTWAGLRAQPAGTWGFALAHMAVALFTVGVTTMSVGAESEFQRVRPGDTVSVAGYDFTLGPLREGGRDNYVFRGGDIAVSKDGRDVASLYSEQRFFPVRRTVTSEAGFRLHPGPTLFAALGDGLATVSEEADNTVMIRAYYQPGVVWIWAGALLMALAGFVSLFDRRLRVPAPAASPVRERSLAASPTLVPAE